MARESFVIHDNSCPSKHKAMTRTYGRGTSSTYGSCIPVNKLTQADRNIANARARQNPKLDITASIAAVGNTIANIGRDPCANRKCQMCPPAPKCPTGQAPEYRPSIKSCCFCPRKCVGEKELIAGCNREQALSTTKHKMDPCPGDIKRMLASRTNSIVQATAALSAPRPRRDHIKWAIQPDSNQPRKRRRRRGMKKDYIIIGAIILLALGIALGSSIGKK
jgi:hypothetical protein